MSDDLSRRKLLKSAAVATTSMAIPIAMSQDKAQGLEKQLKVELSGEAKALLKTSLHQLEQASTLRHSFKLPENSEPCFRFVVTPAKGRNQK